MKKMLSLLKVSWSVSLNAGQFSLNLNVMRQSACLVPNPIMVDNYAAFFNCTPVGRAYFSWFGSELLVCCLAHRDPTGVFFSFARQLISYSAPRDLHRRAAY